MSVTQHARLGNWCLVRYHWRDSFNPIMIPWWRQLLSLVFGLGVMLIALFAIKQGSGPVVILGTAGIAMTTLLLIFGIEIDDISIGGEYVVVNFSDTTSEDTEATDNDE